MESGILLLLKHISCTHLLSVNKVVSMGLTVRLNFMLKFIGKTDRLLILVFLDHPVYF